MKIATIILVFILSSSNVFAQTGNIKFTARKNVTQNNQIIVYAKNTSGLPISGVLGANNLSVNIGFAATVSGNPTISTTIPSLSFEAPRNTRIGLDSNYFFNGTGTSSSVSFPINTEVEIARVNFNTGSLGLSTTVKLANITNGGSNGVEYNYIAPGGNEESGYTTPFYSNIMSDPLLLNGGGPNDAFSQVYSSLGIGNVALPTKFINFFANKKDDNADLIWTVDNEENNAYFDVQRSLDGRVFTDAIRVNALRNGRTSNTYTIPDVNISRLGKKILYYRIRQVEASGELVYSEVRQLNLTTKNFTIGLYPNPVVSATKLVVDAPEAGKAFIIIRDAAGKTVQQINMEFVKGVNQKELNASMLPAGDYNVTVMGEKFNQTIKMTKAN